MGSQPRAASVSVPEGHAEDSAVVVAYDGSRQAEAALQWAVQEAVAEGAPLDVVVAWQRPLLLRGSSAPDPAEDYARQLAARAADTAARVGGERIVAQVHVEEGPPGSVVARLAEHSRVVVMGTAGHVGRLGALLGSVSRHVADRVGVPVVLLGPDAAGYVESRIVVVAHFGVVDPWAVSWAVQRAASRRHRTLHLLGTWSPPGLGLGVVEERTRRLAHQHAEVAHAETLSQLRQLAADVPVSDALFEGRTADVESTHVRPGDLLVVPAAHAEQRPALSYVRCPVVVVPAGRVLDRPAPAGALRPSSQAQPAAAEPGPVPAPSSG